MDYSNSGIFFFLRKCKLKSLLKKKKKKKKLPSHISFLKQPSHYCSNDYSFDILLSRFFLKIDLADSTKSQYFLFGIYRGRDILAKSVVVFLFLLPRIFFKVKKS